MAGRSHRHRVPTARPPAEALGVVYIWGRGAVGSALRSYLEHENTSVDERDDVARKLAGDHGCPVGLVPDAWAWRVEGADSQKIDELTREDRSVMGWTQNQREQCAPSVALRNALGAFSNEELPGVAPSIEKRFADPAHPRSESDPSRWIARDHRVVFYDAERQEWRLGDYVGA